MLRVLLIVIAGVAAAQIAAAIDSPAVNLQSGWQFAAGDPREGLHTDPTRMPAATTAVVLPHAINAPNTPLWYSNRVEVPRGHALFADADDGAQVFVDGALADHHRRWFFLPESATATRQIVVRVLNNAMTGGLRGARLVAISDVRSDALDVGPLPSGFAPVESDRFRRRMPPAAEPCRFTVWADSQGAWNTFGALVNQMATDPGHFSAGVGDLVNDGSEPGAWRSYVTTLLPLAAKAPVVSIAGNHDYDGFYNDLIARHYIALFRPSGTPWFAWSCGMARFAAIDLNGTFPIGLSAGQQRWLRAETDSREWRDARWRVLMVHQPPWSRSWEGYGGDQPVRDIVSMLADRGLDLAIAGHSHAYEHIIRDVRGRSVHLLITGGAGGGLEAPVSKPSEGDGTLMRQHHFARVEVTARRFAVQAVNTAGVVIDNWRIER